MDTRKQELVLQNSSSRRFHRTTTGMTGTMTRGRV